MSDDVEVCLVCHLPHCFRPLATASLCAEHADKLLKPITHPRPVEPVKRRMAA